MNSFNFNEDEKKKKSIYNKISISEGINTEENDDFTIPKTNYAGFSCIQGYKGHLLYLFPLLNQCIMTKESELKYQIFSIFNEISFELGLNDLYEN